MKGLNIIENLYVIHNETLIQKKEIHHTAERCIWFLKNGIVFLITSTHCQPFFQPRLPFSLSTPFLQFYI